MNKKGEIEGISGFALTIGSFAVIMIVVFVILGNLGSNSAVVSTDSKIDSNDVNLINATSTYFADYDSLGNLATGCSNVNVYNETNAANITGSVTISGCYATLKDVNYNNTDPEINYTMTMAGYSYAANATRGVEDSLIGLVSWLPIIIVAFIGGIILMLVIKQFSDKQ